MAKAIEMSYEEVMAQLEAAGSPNARAVYAKNGAGENQFGVLLGMLRGLAKKLKTQHALALQLWASNNLDAMILATMVMDPGQISLAQIEEMVAPLTYAKVVDELTYNVIAKTAHAEALREPWMRSPEEYRGRAGWDLMLVKLHSTDPASLDLVPVLDLLERSMKGSPFRKLEAMNLFLGEVGVNFSQHTARCIAIGEQVGHWDPRPTPKGCTTTYVPEWIAAVRSRKEAAA